ncbi:MULTISPECIES: HNH endonuclease signature motif containing protein [Paraburkholderia]|uniref:HNH endonuclease signature motif containing protein n=1 Tax=Paraburkholderia TaxID=1822464 RepID=UPI0004893FFF|nr:HNH endonuclease signature motif containing protein [Paraburkholderia ferrariae]
MEYYRFNIGKPNTAHETNEWWAENLVRGVITAGFDGSVGDEGEKHLRALNEGDWVLAYVSKKGFVGAGRVLALETYKLHAHPPKGTLSDHQHERSVKWEYVIRDVEQAISEHEAGLYHPVSTCQRVTDVAAAEHLIAMLRACGEHLAEPASMLSITSTDLVALLDSLDAPILITKNKRPESSWTFREDREVDGRYLDGFWTTRPTLVKEGHGYVLHHVVHESVIWLGPFGGSIQDGDGRYSYVMDAATPFLLLDFGHATAEQRALWAILKQEGPVVTYYEPRGVDGTSPSVAFALAKRRLQQANFRLAVFAHHGVRCKVTGCRVPELLEAAHLRGRNWQDGHNAATDGIPLRVDLHRAYDRGLIKLDAQHQLVTVADKLREQYAEYLRAE